MIYEKLTCDNFSIGTDWTAVCCEDHRSGIEAYRNAYELAQKNFFDVAQELYAPDGG